MKSAAFTAVILATLFLAVLGGEQAQAQVKQDHPRIWLTPELKAELVDRLNRNTTNAQALRDWCDDHMNDSGSNYINNRATSLLQAINHALLYQLEGNTSYADRAVEIILYAFDHPYSSYTIDSWVGFDNYYNTRYLMPAVALVTDWCWDNMTTAQRDRCVNQLDRWCSLLIADEPWSWRDPSNNFYFGHMWGLVSAAYAIYHHSPNAPAYLAEGKDVMMTEGIKYTKNEETAWPIFDNYTGRAKGGIWNEGTAYGCVNNDFLPSAILAVRSAEDPNYASDFPFANEFILAYLHSSYPNGIWTYSDGDGATRGTVNPTVRVPILFTMALAEGRTIHYGQKWINDWSYHTTWGYKLYNEFIWYDDQLEEVDYTREVGNFYYLEGVQTLFWRSDWTSDACWVMMKMGVLNTDHAHNGLGNFIIYRNGYLAADKSAIIQADMAYSDADHNDLFIQPSDDRRLYWGHSVVEHIENTADYIYFAGDLTGPYTAQPDYRNNVVAHKEREFLFIKDELALVIMDRGSTFEASRDKVFQLYTENTPTASGSDYRVSNGTWDMVLHPAWPSNAYASAESNGIPILRVRTPETSQEKAFLNVVKVTATGESFQTAPVSIDNQELAGTAFQSGGGVLDYVAVFSNDIDGDMPQFSNFTMTYNYYSTVIRVFVADLDPNTTYYYGHQESGGAIAITVATSGGGMAGSAETSNEGVLSFLVYPGEEPQPLVAPQNPKIR